MSDVAIRVENLSKRYRIGPRERYKTLRESLTSAITSPLRRWHDRRPKTADGSLGPPSPVSRPSPDSHIWALRDVSFSVRHGEVLGIIGRNGAGKSTLLKILSRITKPTQGRAEIHGRVGSLLEVGTGFHPELTGRENIYLNGAILGMRKAEIDHKFDEMVAFAEVEKFIDTPVKHYSSGMYVRLAFAVAGHLESEILLVDEVLAVGDLAFQRKCLGKMGEAAQSGRTVLLVSHQLNQIRRLSSQCIWLSNGHIHGQGSTTEVTAAYELAISTIAAQKDEDQIPHALNRPAQFLRWEITTPQGSAPNVLSTFGPFTVRFLVSLSRSLDNGHHGIALWNTTGQLMWAWAVNDLRLNPGDHDLIYQFPGLPLQPGAYHWQVSLYADGVLLDNWFCSPELIIDTQTHGHPRDEWCGVLNFPINFRTQPQE
jgi:lipopolysaccharide transport system ATP-binding protein